MANMKVKDFFKWIWLYCKERMCVLQLLLLFSLIFAVVFALYRVYFGAVFYAFLLCFFVGGIVGAVDFLHFYRLNQQLKHLQKSVTIELSDLPETNSLTQWHYQELLRLLDEKSRESKTYSIRKREELIDYYTMWAHQIKTPISAMRLLLQTEEHSQSAQLFSELFRIEEYVQMVLSYLRLEGPNDFVLQQYQLDDIVKHAVRKYAPLFIRQKITLDLGTIHGAILTDEKWLCFVLEQLLSNALKYTPKGKISIYMEGEKNLVIQDTGIGIAPEDLPRIGEKGFTGYNGRAQKQATGLGLYLCKKVLKKLSHHIVFESEIGRGTKVTLNFDTVLFVAE